MIPERCSPATPVRGSHFGSRGSRPPGGEQTPRIVATGMWGRDEAEIPHASVPETSRSIVSTPESRRYSELEAQLCAPRMRWRRLAKAAIQVHLGAIAYDPKRALSTIMAALTARTGLIRFRASAGERNARARVPL